MGMTDKDSRPDPGIRPGDAELMEETRKMRLAELQHIIRRGEYKVDTRAVADAILRRLQKPKVIRSEQIPLRESARSHRGHPRRR